jgi:homoserine dehydrogenase
MGRDLIVLKFGSSLLRSTADIPAAVHEIYRWYRGGARVLVVVSAIGKTTDQLLAQARELSPTPDPMSTAQLLAVGERASAALLGIALDRVGVPSRVLDPGEISLTVVGEPLDSEPVGVDATRLRLILDRCAVVVVPGFFGYGDDGALRLLGRGGSDLTAVFLAHSLRAQQCRLLKDVDGVYEFDPQQAESPPQRFAALGYADALRVAGRLIQPKAVTYLATCGATAEVAAPGVTYESIVHSGATVRAASPPKKPPTRVVLLGPGTVGFGVYQRLITMPQFFSPLGVFVRYPKKYEIPDTLTYTDEEAVLALSTDVVVDALPESDVSRRLVQRFLDRGVDIVSVNDEFVADDIEPLRMIKRNNGCRGSWPAIEAVIADLFETRRAHS